MSHDLSQEEKSLLSFLQNYPSLKSEMFRLQRMVESDFESFDAVEDEAVSIVRSIGITSLQEWSNTRNKTQASSKHSHLHRDGKKNSVG